MSKQYKKYQRQLDDKLKSDLSDLLRRKRQLYEKNNPGVDTSNAGVYYSEGSGSIDNDSTDDSEST